MADLGLTAAVGVDWASALEDDEAPPLTLDEAAVEEASALATLVEAAAPLPLVFEAEAEAAAVLEAAGAALVDADEAADEVAPLPPLTLVLEVAAEVARVTDDIIIDAMARAPAVPTTPVATVGLSAALTKRDAQDERSYKAQVLKPAALRAVRVAIDQAMMEAADYMRF